MLKRKRTWAAEKGGALQEVVDSLADSYFNIMIINVKDGTCRYVRADQDDLVKSRSLRQKKKNGQTWLYEEWRQTTMKMFIHPDYREWFWREFDLRALREMGADRTLRPMIYLRRTSEGREYRWVQAEFIDYKPGGKRGDIFLYMKDITGERMVEWQRERELRAAFVEEKRLNRIKEEFLEYLSTELTTPAEMIAGIQKKTREAVKSGDTSKALQYIQMTASATDYLLSMMTEAADVSQMYRDKLIFHKEKFDIADIMHSCNDLLRILTWEKKLSCMWVGKLEGWYIGDEKRIRQMIFSVIEDVVRFARVGDGIRIEVIKKEINGLCDQLMICFRDTSPGRMDMVAHRQFYVSENDRRSRIRMNIAGYIVESMGGSMHQRSEPGAGTAITLKFPLERVYE